MSCWTSLHGHIEGIFEPIVAENVAMNYLAKVVGKELVWDDNIPEDEMIDEWNYAFDHPELYLPLGSEGSLHPSYSYDSSTGKYVVCIDGNLRDVSGTERLTRWFMDICYKLNPEKARVCVDFEGWDVSKWHYKSPCGRIVIREERDDQD